MTRKEFIGRAWGVALLPFALFAVLMTRKHSRVTRPRVVTIEGGLPEGISFHDQVIGINAGGRIAFFSERCTHLGCKITRAEQGNLVCPCHGSAYAPDGQVLRGPASQGLKPLEHDLDPATGIITVFL